jgi:hypothetical protein
MKEGGIIRVGHEADGFHIELSVIAKGHR